MERKKNIKILSAQEALFKIKNWCAYQERSQHDVRQKLFEYFLNTEDLENVITTLIEENFLNEERFAIAFVNGKLRIKNWGRIKIKIELRKHKVSDYSINIGLKQIDELEYEKIIINVIEKKLRLTKDKNNIKLYYSVLNYLISRGFESDLISEQLEKIIKIK